MLRNSLVVTICLLALGAAQPAAGDELIRLEDPDAYQLSAVGFELPRDATITVDAVGIRLPHKDELAVTAWVLDTESRKTVWKMTRRNSDRVKGSSLLRHAEEDVALSAGRYELYFFAGDLVSGWSLSSGGGLRHWLGMKKKSGDKRDYRDALPECYVSLSSDDVSSGDLESFKVSGGLDEALLRFNMLGDSEFIRQGIELRKAMALRVYALIEYPKGDNAPADYAWIVDTESREVVWRTKRRNTERAGGGKKNRLFDDEVELDPGRYVLCYGTDDSHSYEEFNVNPPFDPLNWGVTVLPGGGFDKGAFSTFDVGEGLDPLVSFTRALDSEFFEQPFRLKRDGSVHVYALGEYDYSEHEFADYAWIEDLKSGKTAWQMTRRNTMGAGGADKNLMFDGLVQLKEGDYAAYYVTDASHAYDSWNAATPFDPRAWGVTIYPTEQIEKKHVELLSVSDVMSDAELLANLVRAGDHDRLRQRFTLDKGARIHIHALGEGLSGDMYDYGYIVDDDSGRTVWEMRYRQTEHAGGARKNRLFDDEIRLDAGTYEAIYVTDDSHSFAGWNERRPDDPLRWGMTVRLSD